MRRCLVDNDQTKSGNFSKERTFNLLRIKVAAEADQLEGGQNIVKALSRFENKLIYAGCDDAYRLNPSGNIKMQPEATDFFCSGPCLIETQLLLECIDNMLSNFIFYNKANNDNTELAESVVEIVLFRGLNYLAEMNGIPFPIKTAKVNYEANGWAAHQVSDIRAKTSPDRGMAVLALWPMGGAWLCCHG
ncbi:hypothetical protein P8452_32214 [Trifolium repens]|nr:hypothetical protein P8452_32214 [Trifolium repens]